METPQTSQQVGIEAECPEADLKVKVDSDEWLPQALKLGLFLFRRCAATCWVHLNVKNQALRVKRPWSRSNGVARCRARVMRLSIGSVSATRRKPHRPELVPEAADSNSSNEFESKCLSFHLGLSEVI